MQTAGKLPVLPRPGGKRTGPPGGKETWVDKLKKATEKVGEGFQGDKNSSPAQGYPLPPKMPQNTGMGPITNTGMSNTGLNTDMSNNQESSGNIFDKIFLIIISIGIIAVFALLVVCFMNFIRLLMIKIKERRDAKNNKLIIRDTIEYKFLNYSNESMQEKQKKNESFFKNVFSTKKTESSIKNDPLFINEQIIITTILYQIIGIFIFALIVNILFSLLPLIKMLKSEPGQLNGIIIDQMKQQIGSVDKKYYYGLAGILFITILSSLLLQFVFKTSVNNVIFNIKLKAYKLKQNIGLNLYVDKTFIDMLYSDNFDSIKNIIRSNINGNVQVASKMIFTYNVYQHYITNFKLSGKHRQEFKEAFTYDNLKTGAFEPIEFLIYKDDIEFIRFVDHFIDDVKSVIEATNNTDDVDLMHAYTRNKIGDITLQDDVSNKLKIISDIAVNFRQSNLDKSYKEIFKFTLIMFIVAILLIILLFAFAQLFEKPKQLTDKFIEILKGLAGAIGNWVKLPFAAIAKLF